MFEAFKASKPAPPVSVTAVEPEVASPPAPQEEQSTTTVTPSGVEIQYVWAPRRLYRLNGTEVPSVTTVLDVLEKPQLVWWGMKVGVEGVRELALRDYDTAGMDVDQVVALLTEHKLTVNHQRDKAADRGVNVHGALEAWCNNGELPEPPDYAENERGYVEGLNGFLMNVLLATDYTKTQQELMVGSLQHSYAGRFDLVLTLSKPVEVVTKIYPKRAPKIEEIPAGRYLLDLKTSKGIYNTHYLQLEAYEAAAVECGYAPTDHRGVVHVTADGRYELALNKDWCFEDFLAVRACYQVMNEREILRVLREDLDAKEAA